MSGWQRDRRTLAARPGSADPSRTGQSSPSASSATPDRSAPPRGIGAPSPDRSPSPAAAPIGQSAHTPRSSPPTATSSVIGALACACNSATAAVISPSDSAVACAPASTGRNCSPGRARPPRPRRALDQHPQPVVLIADRQRGADHGLLVRVPAHPRGRSSPPPSPAPAPARLAPAYSGTPAGLDVRGQDVAPISGSLRRIQTPAPSPPRPSRPGCPPARSRPDN